MPSSFGYDIFPDSLILVNRAVTQQFCATLRKNRATFSLLRDLTRFMRDNSNQCAIFELVARLRLGTSFRLIAMCTLSDP